MTVISIGDVHHLATLGGLTLSDHEIQSLQVDIEKIIEYINVLDRLDVSEVEPTYQVTDLVNIGRGDDVDQSEVSRDQLLKLAPESRDGQIKVPKVL